MKVSNRRSAIVFGKAVRKIRRICPRSKGDAAMLLLVLLLGGGMASALLSVNGIYNLFRLLQLRPVYWLSYVTVAIAALTASISGVVCKSLGRFAVHWWPGCQRRCDCAA